jgi:hypothetical protein
VLFTADAHAGLADGTITVTFRTWRQPQVKVGGRYLVGETSLLVDDLRQVPVGSITDDDARQAGEPDRAALVARLSGPTRGRYATTRTRPEATDDTLVWRVGFSRVDDDTPRLADQDDLDADAVAEIEQRLDRLDATSSHGPWTRAVLDLIAAHPEVVSTTLATELGVDRQVFKTDVRKLKRLGLTESLAVGYRLSPRGEAWRRTTTPR